PRRDGAASPSDPRPIGLVWAGLRAARGRLDRTAQAHRGHQSVLLDEPSFRLADPPDEPADLPRPRPGPGGTDPVLAPPRELAGRAAAVRPGPAPTRLVRLPPDLRSRRVRPGAGDLRSDGPHAGAACRRISPVRP